MKHAEWGYTLVEIVFALSIVAILTFMSVTNYTEQIPHQQLRDASAALVGELRLVRQKAISGGTPTTISFDPNLREYKDPFIGVQTLPSHIHFSASNVTKSTDGDRDLPDDGISFVGNRATFGSNGTGNQGAIYLTNTKKESVAITVNITGRVKKFLWSGRDWK